MIKPINLHEKIDIEEIEAADRERPVSGNVLDLDERGICPQESKLLLSIEIS